MDSKYLTEIDLSNNSIDDECITSLGELLAYNVNITEICIGRKITDNGIDLLASNLIGNTSLICLDIKCNSKITDKSSPNLKSIILSTTLTAMKLKYTSISNMEKEKILNLLRIPKSEREIPMFTKTKSAAKVN